MRLLVIKLSSLGDVIHALPALTDAAQQFPELHCDWVVEEGLAEVPAWHAAANNIFSVALRRWRKQFPRKWPGQEWRSFKQLVQANQYDHVIDAQGLLKSAWLSRLAHGTRHGLNRHSAREPSASWFYHHKHDVPWGQHAVERVRQLFATALGYSVPDTPPNYGLHQFASPKSDKNPMLIFFHGASWESKCWPESYWIELAERAIADKCQVRLPWGNEVERERAQRIADATSASVLPSTNLHGMAQEISQAHAVIGVDTGLSHLAAALGVPSITMYGPTQPDWTGTLGPSQQHAKAEFPCAPCLNRTCQFKGVSSVQPACYQMLPPHKIYGMLEKV
ncbi:MAG: lipopolysaccharide heptosyltransferase I [Pseudomonadota bacterium]